MAKSPYVKARLDALRQEWADDQEESAGPLPKAVYRKHGAYYLVHKNKWLLLGKTRQTARASYTRLIGDLQSGDVSRRCLLRLYYSAKSRAKRKNYEFALDQQDVFDMWDRQAGKCSLTGLPMFEHHVGRQLKRRPWMPSIDRIDSYRGYTKDNVRLVCFAVNVALNAWGEDVVLRLAGGMLHTAIERDAAAEREHIGPAFPRHGRGRYARRPRQPWPESPETETLAQDAA